MQGAWYVRVKSKSAGFTQRYIISGASSGNGTYAGVTSTPEVFVTGSSWNIRIQNDPGSGFLNSTLKITNPKVIGGEYVFELQSNDAGSDEDFNDLILSFRTPVTAQDYIVYGNISYYKGCVFNPCHRFLVIDSYLKLKEAVVNPIIRDAVKAFYPAMHRLAFNPQPEPPASFTPLVLSLTDQAIPSREKVITISEPCEIEIKANKKEGRESYSYAYESLKTSRMASISDRVSLSDSQSAVLGRSSRIELSKIADRFKFFCQTGPIAHAQLKLQEYDRSQAELLGDPYTGSGSKEDLGNIIADSFGNYIFRYTRSFDETLNEIDVDMAAGESAATQYRPDLIMSLLDPFSDNTALFETAPYWNVPFLKRINLCIPKGQAGLVPSACSGQHIIQGVGNIALGASNGAGERLGGGNSLNNSGLVTAKADIAPQVRCAAFTGNLLLKGCLSNPEVKYYTLEYRNRDRFESWQDFTQTLRLPKIVLGQTVQRVVNRSFGPSNSIEGYLNVETDSGAWLPGYHSIKAMIRTASFDNGRYSFKIQGYDGSGSKIGGTQEVIHLYLQDTNRIVAIDPEVSLGDQSLGNCALFQLPMIGETVVEDAPMTIRFKVEHNPGPTPPKGFINHYELSILKGATGSFAVNLGVEDALFAGGALQPTPNRGRRYVHTDDTDCLTIFKGTVNEIAADADGYITASLQPASGGWLLPDQKFCAFAIHLGGTLRLTNGSGGYTDFHATPVLVGIERP